jgi:putative endonuclease
MNGGGHKPGRRSSPAAKDGRKQRGNLGEQAAFERLSRKYRILYRNWRCRTGEIDLIAEDGEVLVFVEVRTRQNGGSFGTPAESVDYRKQRRVRKTAQIFLQQHRGFERPIRFDVVSVILDHDGKPLSIEHIRGAF